MKPTPHQLLLGQIYGLGIDCYRALELPEPGQLTDKERIVIVAMIRELRRGGLVAGIIDDSEEESTDLETS